MGILPFNILHLTLIYVHIYIPKLPLDIASTFQIVEVEATIKIKVIDTSVGVGIMVFVR